MSKILAVFFSILVSLLFLSQNTAYSQDASRPVPVLFAKIPNYSSLDDWQKITNADEQLQKQFVLHMEELGYRNKFVLLKFKTPHGNAVPELKGAAQPLSGLVVTHSMDETSGRNNDVAKYLGEGYDALGVDKSGVVYVRGTSFLRTQEEFVPNLSTINISFDVNAELGERVNAAQVKTAADIAEALQKAFTDLETGVKIYFMDHHDKGLKSGKKYLEAGPARDAANNRLKAISR